MLMLMKELEGQEKMQLSPTVMNILESKFKHNQVHCSHYLKDLSSPIGEVALLQLLQLSSRSVRLRKGMGAYVVWLLLLGRY